MNVEEFSALADAWGGHPDRWPDDLRDAAEALLQESTEAQALLADAKSLDVMLASAADVPVKDALLQSLMAIPATEKQERRAKPTQEKSGGFSLSFRFLFPRLGGVAVSAALIGFVMGTANIVPVDSVFETANVDTEMVDLSELMFLGEDDEVDT
jgi:hypothetical protein